jgi:serine phosphatase RsbU (regulator of sigma subunit)
VLVPVSQLRGMYFTRTFKISGLATLAGSGMIGVGFGLKPAGILLLFVALPVFAVSATRHLLRGLLWRVGSRLFVSYILIGVLPLPLLFLLAYGGVYLLSGQLAGRRVEAALQRHQAALERIAAELIGRFEAAPSAAERRAQFSNVAARETAMLPNLGYAYQPKSRAVEGSGPLPAAELLPRRALERGSFSGIARLKDQTFLAVLEYGAHGELVVIHPLGDKLRRQIEKETAVGFSFTAADFEGDQGKGETAPAAAAQPAKPSGKPGLTVRVHGKEAQFKVLKGPDEQASEVTGQPDLDLFKGSSAGAGGRGPIFGRWVYGILPLEQPVVDWGSGAPASAQRLLLLVNSSVATEYRRLFAHSTIGEAGEDTGTIVLKIMVGLGVFTGVVYLLASLLAGLLVLRIARATRRLTVGFGEINRANFSHRATLRGRDQLAGLVEDFNRMAGHLEASVQQRAEKEALELQLQVARDLQRRLLPSSDFEFPGVEIATDFRPAAAIGGDFYHFVVEGEQRLVVVIADVSGHGLATGIVMAAAKAALSALASTGANTTAILHTLDQEILRTTDRRTFVTLAHARFRLDQKLVEFTNAGHLYPYRIAAGGQVTSIENPSRPLGVELPSPFTTVQAELAGGDLWVFFSDGIIEATSAAGEPFGFERLERVLAGSAGISAAELRDRILSEWRAFTGHDDPEDDRTLIVFQIA